MAFLLKLGPVHLSGVTTNVYLKVSENGDVAQPVFQPDDAAGLRELVGADDPQVHLAEPGLAEAAGALNVRVEEPPVQALKSRSAIAVYMAWGQRGLSSIGSEAALRLIHAGTAFWFARPWTTWRDDQPLAVTITGAVERVYEGSIFGERGQGYGLALYEEKGALKKLLQLQEQGRDEEARKLPGVGVLFDDKPEYACRALEAAGQVPRLPVPIRSGPEGANLPRPEETAVLAATLHAISQLSGAVREATAELETPGGVLRSQVRAPNVALLN